MNKDLHNMDDFFKSAYQQFEEEPSLAVWEKINASLDKTDAESSKGKFILLRRTTILLLLVLAGFVLFDSGILKIGSGEPGGKTIREESHAFQSAGEKNEAINSSDKLSEAQDEKNTAANIGGESNFFVKEQNVSNLNIKLTVGANKPADKKAAGNDDGLVNDKLTLVNPIVGTEKNLTVYLNESKIVQKEQLKPVSLFENNNAGNLFTRLPGSLSYAPLQFAGNADIKKTDTKKNTKSKREKRNSFSPYWLMTAFASYDRANYKLDSDIPNNITSIKHREVHEPSFSGGILATRQLAKHWGLQTGLVYFYTVIGISPQKMYAFQDPGGDIAYKFITSSGYAFIKPRFGQPPTFGDSLTAAESAHTLKSISVPLSAKFRMEKNKLSFTPGAGIEANVITHAKVEVELTDVSNREIVLINKLNGSRSLYLSAVADAEVQYKLNKNLSVSLHPTFRYALSPITENNVVETFPYSLGIRVGLSHKF